MWPRSPSRRAPSGVRRAALFSRGRPRDAAAQVLKIKWGPYRRAAAVGGGGWGGSGTHCSDNPTNNNPCWGKWTSVGGPDEACLRPGRECRGPLEAEERGRLCSAETRLHLGSAHASGLAHAPHLRHVRSSAFVCGPRAGTQQQMGRSEKLGARRSASRRPFSCLRAALESAWLGEKLRKLPAALPLLMR